MTMKPLDGRPMALLALGALVCAAAPARAQEDVLGKVKDLNRKAVEAYENLELEEARKYLMQALETCASEGLNTHPSKAQTHVNLGVVFVGGLKQREQGIRQFKRALEIDSNAKVPKRLQNPEIVAAFEEAQKGMASSPVAEERPAAPEPPPAPAPAAPAPAAARGDGPPAGVKGVFHEPLTEAKPGETINVRVAVEAALGAEKVVLAYRPEGASDFLARDMEADDKGWLSARIPSVATTGNTVAYYVEARDRAGAALASNGSAAEPHVVSLAALPARPGKAVAGDDPPGVRERSSGGGGGLGEGKVFLGLAVGGGGGWTKGRPEVNRTDNRGEPLNFDGMAPASLLHVAPEIGYVVSPQLLLSLQGRFQLVTGATRVVGPQCGDPIAKMDGTCEPAKGAVAVLAKATYLLTEGGAFRPYLSLSAGGGQIRHLVDLSQHLRDCGDKGRPVGCIDTVVAGTFLVGPSAGFFYGISDVLNLAVAVNSLVGVPQTMVNFDVNVGLAAAF
jgi:tetratricopeptide (TPR) repeat protein